MAADIVVDLGFGDSGKGTLTDWLVRQSGSPWVVRFNGGGQAGHTVVLRDGRWHIFSQLGAGSFVPGVGTYLSAFTVVHPTALLREIQALGPRTSNSLLIDPEALLITPFHQAAGRLREWARGEQRHGSCGIGFGEAYGDALEEPQGAIRAGDLLQPGHLLQRLQQVQQRKWSQLRHINGLPAELAVLESASMAQEWLAASLELAPRVGRLDLRQPQNLVFEGAQGVLLDEWRGFHPHTTWSTCTFANALELLGDWPGPRRRWGVLRCYLTRHGAGPFPSQSPELDFPEPHNRQGPWQGAFRQGWPDAVLARYALECCGGVDGLALTHCDRLQGSWKMVTHYRLPDGSLIDRLPLGPLGDLQHQVQLTRLLEQVQPVYETLEAGDFPQVWQQALGVPLWLTSQGPCPEDKVAWGANPWPCRHTPAPAC